MAITTTTPRSRGETRAVHTSSKLSRKEAARKIISLIECDMTKRELTEVEKNQATREFAGRIDRAIAARRKS